MNRPRIAICVVTFNSASLVEGLAASIPGGARGIDWTLVFADNDSSDDTVAEIARWAPSASVVQTGSNLGYAGGLNAAIRAAGACDAYLVLNADVRLTDGCLAKLYTSLDARTGIAVPRLVDADNQLIWSMRREPTLLRAWADTLIGAERAGRLGRLGEVVADPDLYDSARPTDWAEGSTQLISADCVRSCGLWDESFFLYSEETEYNLRVRDLGFSVRYEPNAVAQHLKGDSAVSPPLWSLLVMNKIRLYRRRHGWASSALFWLAILVREASRAAVFRKRTSLAALRVLLRPRYWRTRRGPGWLEGIRS